MFGFVVLVFCFFFEFLGKFKHFWVRGSPPGPSPSEVACEGPRYGKVLRHEACWSRPAKAPTGTPKGESSPTPRWKIGAATDYSDARRAYILVVLLFCFFFVFGFFVPNTPRYWVLVLNSTPPARRDTEHHTLHTHHTPHNTHHHTSTPHTTHHTPHRRLP